MSIVRSSNVAHKADRYMTNDFGIRANIRSNPPVPVPAVEDMTEDMTPPPGASRLVLKRSIAAYTSMLRSKYGRADYYRVYLVAEAAELNRRREALRIRSQEIGKFYNNALKVPTNWYLK